MARIVEEVGISTIVTCSARDIMRIVKAPRNVFVNFPLGQNTGKPFDIELQFNILENTFGALKAINKSSTTVELAYKWSEDNSWENN